MDTRLLKFAPPLPVRLPDGSLLHLKPLSTRRVEELGLTLDLQLRVLGAQVLGRKVVQLQLLELAAGQELAELLHDDEIEALFKRWRRWQERCNDTKHLAWWLERRCYDDPDTIRDGLSAHRAKTPDAYYNRPEVDLTDGQVAYWQLLAGSFAKWHGPSNGPRKVPTKQWLNKGPDE